MKYIDHLKIAEKNSIELGLDPRLDLKSPMTAEKIKIFNEFCSRALLEMLFQQFKEGDWGQQCLNIASQAFAILQHYKVPCELVYGEVKIGKIFEFETTIEGLKKELLQGESDTSFAIHVWINLGKDYIIDPTISSRIHKYYDKSCPQNIIFYGKSRTLLKQKLEYIPMLAGVKYLDVTCGIPLTYQAKEQTA